MKTFSYILNEWKYTDKDSVKYIADISEVTISVLNIYNRSKVYEVIDKTKEILKTWDQKVIDRIHNLYISINLFKEKNVNMIELKFDFNKDEFESRIIYTYDTKTNILFLTYSNIGIKESTMFEDNVFTEGVETLLKHAYKILFEKICS